MFRIIMPVYNAQEYLEKAVDSIINQTLSFKDNVVVHLIDDSSGDGSLELCNKYKERYPDNFIVTHFEENQGVSAVRNYGLKMCRHEKNVIAGFVDSDDYLDDKALETVWNFFEKHNDVQLVSSKIYYFGSRNEEHKSNWRFEEKEVVNIKEDFNYPQYYIGGVFLRGKALRKLKFDVDMDFWEDAMAINKVILKLGKYGLAQGAIYYYRKMENQSSLVDKAWRKKERYTTFLEDGYKNLMKYCLLRKFKVIPYIQYVIAYHLRLFLLESNREVVMEMVPEEEMQAFKDRLSDVLQKVSDEVICKMNTALPVIEMELSLKYKKKVRVQKVFTDNDVIFKYGDIELARLSERNVRVIGIMDKPGYEGMLRGRFSTPVYAMGNDDYIFAKNGDEIIKTERYKCKKRLYVLDVLMRNYKNAGFVVRIPEGWEEYQFGIHINDVDVMLDMKI